MKTNVLHYFAVIAILTVISVTNADVDCNGPPPAFVHPKECCPIPNLISDDIEEACQEFKKPGGMPGPPGGMGGPPGGMPGGMGGPPKGMGGPPKGMGGHGKGHHHRHHNPCFISCFFNETGIIVNGEMLEEVLNSYLTEVLEDPLLTELMSNNFLECFDNIKNEALEMQRLHGGRGGHGPPHHQCPHDEAMIFGCAKMKTLHECPEGTWTDTDECNAARDYWKECHPRPGGDIEEEEDDEEENQEDEI